MKANEIPEKIYVPTAVLEMTDKLPCHIEYTRTDTLIEKAWNWVEDNLLSSNQQDKSLLYYEQFKKYLEE